ncbi:DNA primase [Lautropia dentalis]|uniref:DNA primase n=1 Tax=Lautropia dentalis TaxID=2490857 RepID=UPI001EEFAD8C|nr:DNA primase [Lautropia dentalis]
MIPQSFIQELLTRVDIVDVVGRSVKLKKAGANYQGLCPFHNEKTPSFSVSPTKQFYHCFGCGAHGSSINFLMEHFGMGFVEAVHELARDAGLTVPEDNSREGRDAAQKASQQLALSQWMDRAAAYYRLRLKETPAAIQYLKDRGVSGETAKRFGLGYAPAGWRNLEGVLPDYAAEDAERAGLVIAGDEGRRYDRFRERVMFPIRNPRGQIIGFGGRVMGAGEPKYLNSPEGPLFSKGHELYGLYEAREGIRETGRVLVVEGYMDVVMLHQYGCTYAVATLGTATTAVHITKLLRQADRIVFAFDGDSAGRRAAWRALENALPVLSDTKQLDFLFLPPEHDPDSFVREEGLEAFEALVRDALPLSSFLLKELASRGDITTPEGRARMQAELKPLVLQMPDIALRTQILVDMAGRLGLHTEELASYVGLQLARPAAPSGRSGQVRNFGGAGGHARAGNDYGARQAGRSGASRSDGRWGGAAQGAGFQGAGSHGAHGDASGADPYGRGTHAGGNRSGSGHGGWTREGGAGRPDGGRAGAGDGRWGGAVQGAAGHDAGRRGGYGDGSRGADAAGRDRNFGSRAGRDGGFAGRSGFSASGPGGAGGGRLRPTPTTLVQRVCLLLAYYPALAQEPLEDENLLPQRLLDWRARLAGLPVGAHFASVLAGVREESPAQAAFIEQLDEKDAGVMASMGYDEAQKDYFNALDRLRLDQARHELVRAVSQGLDEPGVRTRYEELTAVIKRLSERGAG